MRVVWLMNQSTQYHDLDMETYFSTPSSIPPDGCILPSLRRSLWGAFSNYQRDPIHSDLLLPPSQFQSITPRYLQNNHREYLPADGLAIETQSSPTSGHDLDFCSRGVLAVRWLGVTRRSRRLGDWLAESSRRLPLPRIPHLSLAVPAVWSSPVDSDSVAVSRDIPVAHLLHVH
jgi:hypothetical protein